MLVVHSGCLWVFTVSFITEWNATVWFPCDYLIKKHIWCAKTVGLHIPGHSAVKNAGGGGGVGVSKRTCVLSLRYKRRGEEWKREEGTEDIASVQYRCAPWWDQLIKQILQWPRLGKAWKRHLKINESSKRERKAAQTFPVPQRWGCHLSPCIARSRINK